MIDRWHALLTIVCASLLIALAYMKDKTTINLNRTITMAIIAYFTVIITFVFILLFSPKEK